MDAAARDDDKEDDDWEATVKKKAKRRSTRVKGLPSKDTAVESITGS